MDELREWIRVAETVKETCLNRPEFDMLILYQKQRLKPVRRDTGKFDETPEIKTNKTIMISIDWLTAYLCDFAVGFLKFKDHGKEEMAEPAGSGTFVQLDKIKGILTAGHVIDKLPRKSGQIGLVRFTTIKNTFQNLRIEMQHTSREVLWDGIEGHAPDLGFLSLPDHIATAIEAYGGVFYNLQKSREK